MSFVVLHVCMGNICRSPMAERIFRHRLDARFGSEGADVVSASAGTYQGHAGWTMNPPAVRALDRLGVDAVGFAARGIDVSLVEAADLVLTATQDQCRTVAELLPSSASRVFTLKELAALAGAIDATRVATHDALVDRFAALVTAADDARRDGATLGATLDVEDPYGEPDEIFDATAAEIGDAVERILVALDGRPGS